MVRVQITNGCLDRVRPGALRPHITNEDWKQLADHIDNALRPVIRFIRIRSAIPAIGFICFIYGVITIVTSVDSYAGAGPPAGFIICFASIAFMIVAMILSDIIYWRMCLESQVKHSLENVLQQFSDDYQGGLTAHLIQQHHYTGDGGAYPDTHHHHHALTGNYVLEISVDDQHYKERGSSSSYHRVEEARPKNTTNTATSSSSSSIDVRQRLERLEQLRDALSNEEYQERRRIILGEL